MIFTIEYEHNDRKNIDMSFMKNWREPALYDSSTRSAVIYMSKDCERNRSTSFSVQYGQECLLINE